jgi:Leucine-rich repeat (LRR) protein
MKTKLLLYSLLFFYSLSYAQNTAIPNTNFEKALIDLGYDTVLDGFVTTANISGVTSLNVSSKNISDLTGIEDFTALEILLCLNNQLTTLDISSNTNLKELKCYSNNLTSMDVSNNTALTLLHCYYNNLTSLDVSNNILLEDLACGYSQISSLNLTNNTQLKSLITSQNPALTNLNVSNNTLLELIRCENNGLTSLNVDSNIALKTLYCSQNTISSLNLSNNSNLELLNCFSNQITTLDLSNNSSFISLSCQSNQLTSINLKNGNNTNVTSIATTNNPNLTCIQVDDAAYSTTNWTNVDAQTSFSENCISLNTESFESTYTNIYPNPASNYISIETPLEVIKVELYNILGKLVLNENTPNKINISNFPNGLYIIKIHTTESIVSKKILKK